MAGGKTRKPILPSGGRNIAGHVMTWGRALNDAIGAAQVEKNKLLDESKDTREKLNEQIKAARGSEKKLLQAKLKALSVSARLTDIDARTAWCITSHTIGDLGFYKSAADLAEEMKVSENTADQSLRRIFRAGFLERLPHSKDDYNHGGRPANNYRIPDAFPRVGWENNFPSTDGETGALGKEVSPSCDGGVFPSTDGGVSPSCDGTIMKDRKSEGAGARSRAPQAPVKEQDRILDLIEDEDGKNGDFVAPEGDQSPSSSAISSDEERPANPASEDEEPWHDADPEERRPCEPSEIEPPSELADRWAEAEKYRPNPDPSEGQPDDWPQELDEDVQDCRTEDDAFFFNTVGFRVIEICKAEDLKTLGDVMVQVAVGLRALRFELRDLFPSALAAAFTEAPGTRAGAVRHMRREVSRLLDGDDREADRLVNGLLNKVDALTSAKPRAAIKPNSNVEEAAYG